MPAAVARHGHAERLRGDVEHHAAVDPALHPQGRGDRPLARRPRPLLALHAWMQRVPGGLGIANVFACALFAAMAGSSPATCSAIGSAGIPEMRKRGYSPAASPPASSPPAARSGILLPPSITMILYAVAAEAVARPAVPRRHRPGAAAGRAVRALRGAGATAASTRRARTPTRGGGIAFGATLDRERYTLREKVEMLPRVLPFVILLIGVMVALYGGFATPSETAGPGRRAGAAADRRHLRRLAAARPRADPRATLKESTMLMFIIGMSLLFSYVMSYLHISQSAARVDRRACICRSGCCWRRSWCWSSCSASSCRRCRSS